MVLGSIMESLGLDERQRLYLEYQLRQPGRTDTRTVGDTEGRFHVGTFREYRRIRTLMQETDVLEDALRSTSSDDVFYDVGANVGVYTCFVGQHVGATIALEPHDPTAERLRENAATNGVDADVYEYALASEPGTATLSHPRDSPDALGTGEFSLVDADGFEPTTRVEALPGDELIRREGLPSPTIAKIDVEGAELRALDGLASSLDSCRLLYVEVHRDHVSLEDARSKLREMGYEPALFRDRGNTTFLKGTADSAQRST